MKRTDGVVEVHELVGREKSPTAATFEMVRSVADHHDLTISRRIHVDVTAIPLTKSLESKWATDIGTLGDMHLWRVEGISGVVVYIPFWAHALYRHGKKWVRHRFRNGYLLFTIILAVMSVFGGTPEKISTTEAALLLVPLVFLYRDRINDLVLSLQLRKFGPVEFRDPQPRTPLGSGVDAVLQQLELEFGGAFQKLQEVAKFFVPRTVYLLNVMNHLNRPVDPLEFPDLCRATGVLESNIDATRHALISQNAISIGSDGAFRVTEFGKLVLHYVGRVAQMRSK